MTSTLTILYAICVGAVLVAFLHLVDPTFIREIGDVVSGLFAEQCRP